MKLEESFSSSANIGIKELRTLYYGRYNVFVAFSDDDDVEKSGYQSGRLNRPYGIKAHPINDVVARKVTTSKLWGHIFKYRKAGDLVEDINNYSSIQLEEDIEALYVIPFLDNEDIDQEVDKMRNSVQNVKQFTKFWKLTRKLARLASRGNNVDKFWRRILVELGYDGFVDPKGTGVIGKKGNPVALFVTDKIDVFDIVPIQKTRLDSRKRVWDNVRKVTRRKQAARNRVAKVRTAYYRDRDLNGGSLTA